MARIQLWLRSNYVLATAAFLTYTRTLSFSEEPDYDYIRSLFSTLGHDTSDPAHGYLLDLLPLELALPAPSPSERLSECHTPNLPTLQHIHTTRRRKTADTESTPRRKSSRVAQQHQPGSTQVTPRLSISKSPKICQSMTVCHRFYYIITVPHSALQHHRAPRVPQQLQ